MRYHDFHLSGYTVSNFGERILLHLVYDHAGRSRAESHIEFSGVACYHFIHTEGAIITDLEEEPLSELTRREEEFLSSSAAQHGVRLWRGDAADYAQRLEAGGYHAWRLASAIGFAGFVIAKAVLQKEEPNQPLLPTSGLRPAAGDL